MGEAKINSPEIYSLREMIQKTQQAREVFFFCDFHGHSKNKSSFMFGCNNNRNENDIMKERIFPLMMHKNCEHFHYDNCKFDVRGDKEGTGRVAVKQQFGILNSFTLECSIMGSCAGSLKDHHFNIPALKRIGQDFGKTLYEFSADQKKINGCITELKEMYPTINHLLVEDEGNKMAKSQILNDSDDEDGNAGNLSHRSGGSKATIKKDFKNIRTQYEK